MVVNSAFSQVPPPSLAEPEALGKVLRALHEKLDVVSPPPFSKVPPPSLSGGGPGGTALAIKAAAALPATPKPPPAAPAKPAVERPPAPAPKPVVVVAPPSAAQRPVAIEPAPLAAPPVQAKVESQPAVARPLPVRPEAAPAPRPGVAATASQANTTSAKADKIMVATKAQEHAALAKAKANPASAHLATLARGPVRSALLEPPPLPISAAKQAKLSELLVKDKADEISPEQYHTARAKILAEPEQ